MKSQQIMSSVSIFCEKQHWHLVLKKLHAFNKSNESYFLFLNNEGGPNLRVGFILSKATALQTLQNLNLLFTNYFKENKFTGHKTVISNSIFMPMPLNTVHFGLYPPLKLQTKDKLVLFRCRFSELLMAHLRKKKASSETIFFFVFGGLASIIKVLRELDASLDEVVLYVLDTFIGEASNNVLEADYQSNQELLTGLYSIAHQQYPVDALLPVLANIFSPKTKKQVKQKRFFSVVTAYYLHLGQNLHAQQLISFFLRKCIAPMGYPGAGSNI